MGTIFKMTPAGALTTLVEFTGLSGNAAGSFPKARLVQGSDSNYYGTTGSGGHNDLGAVFRMTPEGVVTSLVQFTGDSGLFPGSLPLAEVLDFRDGSFYGTTYSGGANGFGMIFRVNPLGAGGTEITDQSKPHVSFTMTESVVATANFLTNPYLVRKGTYRGLVSDASGTVRGLVTLTLNAMGSFSLKLLLDGASHSRAAELDLDGHFAGEILRPGRPPKSPIAVTLDLNVYADEPQLTGHLEADTETFTVSATRSAFTAREPTPAEGRHTLAFPRPGNFMDPALHPLGHGHALVRVTEAGAVTATGRLGDGGVLSMGGMFGADDRWAVYVQPYKGTGSLAGLVQFTGHTAPEIDELSGTLRWVKPAGGTMLAGDIAAIGSRWNAPTPFTGTLNFVQGGLAAPIGKSVALDEKNRFIVTPPTPDPATLSLAVRSGLLSGRLTPAGFTRSLSFKGVLLQRQRLGRGVFVAPSTADGTGAVELLVSP